MTIGFPKPARQSEDHVTRKRERDRKGSAFRKAVWKRDGPHCQRCDRWVKQTCELVPEQGHVDHKRGRNVAPQDRYNPDAAQLLCLKCHQRKHGQR